MAAQVRDLGTGGERRSKVRHEETTFLGPGGEVLYQQTWHPDRPPRALVGIVHGFGEHSGRYTNLVAHFVPRGFTVSGFDLVGHGRSEGTRGLIQSWDDFLEGVGVFQGRVRAFAAGAPFFLYGHSLGGLIALEHVILRPEGIRGVIASAPVLGPPGVSPVLLALARPLGRIAPRMRLKAGVDPTALSRDPSVGRAYVDDPLVHGHGSARLGAEMLVRVEWVQQHAGSLHVPLLILHGGKDRLVRPEDSRTFFERVAFQDRERIVYPEGFHESHNDIEQNRVFADVEAWILRHI